MKSDKQRQTFGASIKIALEKFRIFTRKASPLLFTRASAANILMIAFIIMTSVGAWQIYQPIGFIVGGVGCGILGYILGLD